MVIKFKEKTVNSPDLDDLNATVIQKELIQAEEEKVNVVHFSFGDISKVTFDVLVYKK